MKKLENGDIILTEAHERVIMNTVSGLLSMRRDSGQFADWDLMISCTENGSKIKPKVVNLDLYPKVKVER